MHDSRQTLLFLPSASWCIFRARKPCCRWAPWVLGQLKERGCSSCQPWNGGPSRAWLCLLHPWASKRCRSGVVEWAEATRRHPCLRTPHPLSCWAATPQYPQKKPSFKVSPSVPIIPMPSWPLAPPGVTCPPASLSETSLMPASDSTHAEGSTVQDPELSHWAEAGGSESRERVGKGRWVSLTRPTRVSHFRIDQ